MISGTWLRSTARFSAQTTPVRQATAVDADDREGRCRACGHQVALTDDDDELYACYACLRAGRAALTKDTEFGMVRWEDATRGLTHGLPPGSSSLPRHLQRRAPTFDEHGHEEWVKVPLPSQVLLELTRTPSYHTWQGETWLFHNEKPMVYLGSWGKAEFTKAAPDGDGRTLFLAAAAPQSGNPAHDAMVWDALGADSVEAGNPGVYVFRPQDGDGALRAVYDFD